MPYYTRSQLLALFILLTTGLTAQRTFLTLSPTLYARSTETYVAYSDFDGNIINSLILEGEALTGEVALDLFTYRPSEIVVTVINRAPNESGLPNFAGWVIPYPDSNYVSAPPPFQPHGSTKVVGVAESKLGVSSFPRGKKVLVPPGAKELFRKVAVMGGLPNSEILRFDNSLDYGYRILLETDEKGVFGEVYLPPSQTYDEIEFQIADYAKLPITYGEFQVSLPKSVQAASVFFAGTERKNFLLGRTTSRNLQRNLTITRLADPLAGRLRVDYTAEYFQGYDQVRFTEYFAADSDFIDVAPRPIPDIFYDRVGQKQVIEFADSTAHYAVELSYSQALLFPEDSPEYVIRQNNRSSGVIQQIGGRYYVVDDYGQLQMRVSGGTRTDGRLFQLPALEEILLELNAPITGLGAVTLPTLRVEMELDDARRPYLYASKRVREF